ncbi:hypothetical protein [Dictyobacter arantiisoli]|uniref:Uncharacterized protein n=1 Tax=Dictyobacter arantiisoli TaxID=2014874 RepID=A0A5A5T569_9CHLR|nr:hypothetical protein [Dictyobacter arantiisoli]GCF06521.1 hypothetical protein KDI_00850 [Dictyobacter arantiisoli]
MNATLCINTDTALDICPPVTATDDRYATQPMGIVLPKPLPINEEALHASFDEALSERIMAEHSHLSDLTLRTVQSRPLYKTEPLIQAQTGPQTEPLSYLFENSSPRQRWQQWIIFFGLALMFVLIGFDIMGLLVLHMR